MAARALSLRGLAVACLLAVLACYPQFAAAQTPPAGDDLHAVGEAPADSRSVQAQTPDVQTIFRLTNQDRAAQGLAALAWNPELATAARDHAARMAAASREELSHRYPGEPDLPTRASAAGAHFSGIAENIAQGGGAQQIEKQWMNSVPHRTNILDPHMSAIGIAVVASGGTLYAVEDFAATVAQLSRDQVEQRVEAELLAIGAHLSAEGSAGGLQEQRKADARRNCPLATGIAGGSSAGLVLRWEGPDLALPQPVVDAVHSHQANDVAVGACAAMGVGKQGFSAYRVAVALY